MKEIDWSKAPADATHWHDKYDCYVACWVKEQDGQRYYLRADGLSGKWMIDRNPLPIEKCIPRHVAQPAWSGEGLPPVGAMVEIRLMGWSIRESAEKFIGIPLRVAASFRMDCGTDMIAVDGGHDLGCEVFRAEMAVPARTPEQIAAEEREKAIEEMARIGTMADTPKSMAAKLYDAGCRMVTP